MREISPNNVSGQNNLQCVKALACCGRFMR